LFEGDREANLSEEKADELVAEIDPSGRNAKGTDYNRRILSTESE